MHAPWQVMLTDVDPLKARARSLAGGPEPELGVAVDVMFPDAAFAEAAAAFQKNFPATLLRFDIKSSAVIEPVLDGRCAIGVADAAAAATLPRSIAADQGTYSRLHAASPGFPPRARFENSSCRSHPDLTHRSFRYLTELRTEYASAENVAPRSPWGKTRLSACRVRAWGLATALGRGGPSKGARV
jgi:hypothetical protein